MATTFYATNNFTGDGTTVNWNINFADGYIDTTDVKARYLDNTGSYVDIAISSVAGNVVTISPAVANGQEFQIYRDTEKRFPLVDFSDGAILNETNLDTLATQAVMVSAEAFDQSNNGVRIAGDSLVVAQGIDAKAQLALDNSDTAVATANAIDGKAQTALDNSAAAVVTANAAASTATGAANTANTALATANDAADDAATAITTANGAVTTANAATTTANAASAAASAATTTANSAASDAAAAVSTAGTALSTANTASTNASAAVATANDAKTTAEGIEAKADSALAASANAVSTANAAEATANAIDGKATDALNTADAAVATANSASTAADTAVATANAANTSVATKAAKGANSDITSLSGLTTALSVAQGGTGVTDMGSLRRAALVQGVLCNDQAGPQSYNSYKSPNGNYAFKVDNSGLVASINAGNETVVPFAIASGGTGATSDTAARVNLKVDKLVQSPTDTKLLDGSGEHTFFIAGVDWGYRNSSNSSRVALPVASGGTGSTTPEGGSENLGALYCRYALSTYYGSEDLSTGIGFYNVDTSPSPGGNGSPYNYAEIMTIAEGGRSGNWSQIAFSTVTNQPPRYRQRFSNPASITNWRDFLIRDFNTTVDTNGFVKIASPIVKLKPDGSSEVNDQAQGVTTERLGVGVYKVHGVLGFNSDPSWGGTGGGFSIPTNSNGLSLLWVDYAVDVVGDITIRTYHRVHTGVPSFASNEIEGVADGEPVDIPEGRWIDLRVEMPAA